MNPRLIFLNGKLESQIFQFNDLELITIGRAVRNTLVIPDSVLSREHALIRKNSDGFEIEDLNSQNGLLVNDFNASKTQLKNGDRIRIGQTLLLFQTEEKNSLDNFSTEIEFDEDLRATEAELRIPYKILSEKLPNELDALSKIGKLLNEIDDVDKFQERILEVILGIVRADRAAIVMLNDDMVSPNSVCVLNRFKTGNEPMHISRTVCQKVFSEKAAVLINDFDSDDFTPSESILRMGVNSLLCVPLLSGEITGLIYLDSGNSQFTFQTKHLQQMTAIGNLVTSALKNLKHLDSLKRENSSLQQIAEVESDLVGESSPMHDLSQMISKVSKNDATILISGESGTGKELVARAIHKNSGRKNQPFVAINCAVLNENFLDSDLFGHEKGAFTGAITQRKGKVEIAAGGTLFLDEIGELASTLQAKLLRVIQENEFERIGGIKAIRSDVRLIAATNRNLLDEVEKGNFREDLFFRLNVIEIKVPALRERKSDIVLLAEHFRKKYSEKCKRKVIGITHQAKQFLIDHNWRGNVRELENIIERAVVLGMEQYIQPGDLPTDITENYRNTDQNLDLNQQLKIAKSKIIFKAIRESDGNYTEAARKLSIHPNNLHRIIRELDIKDQINNE